MTYYFLSATVKVSPDIGQTERTGKTETQEQTVSVSTSEYGRTLREGES